MTAGTDALARIRTAHTLLAGRPAPASMVRHPVEVDAAPALRTHRLLLRPLRPSDRDEFVRVADLSRSHLARFCPLHRPGETSAMLFARQLAMTDAGERLRRAWRRAIVLGDGRLAGAVNINDLSHGLENIGEINWWISADCTGRGLATDAVELAAAHALDDLPRGLGLTALKALITPDNAPSRRIAAKAGFQRRRWAPPVELNLDGRWVAHETFIRFASIAAHEPHPGPADEGGPPTHGAPEAKPASKRLLRAGLASILATEATTLLRARNAHRGEAPAHRTADLAPAAGR